MLYVAFNKAIQVDAEKRFPRNVQCRTGHSLAYRATDPALMQRLRGAERTRIQDRMRAIAPTIGAAKLDESFFTPLSLFQIAERTVARFLRSAAMEPGPGHLPEVTPITDKPAGRAALADLVVPVARKIWADLQTPRGAGRWTHDTYLKLWQLSQPVLPCDVLLYDECQDADPVIADVVIRQRCQVVAVGDENQAIYGWRGATDFLTTYPAKYRTKLTQSFRFGPAVADCANVFLGMLGSDLRISGTPQLASTVGPVDDPDAVLCRTNGETLRRLVAGLAAGRRVAIVGGGGELRALAEAAAALKAGRPTFHPDLCGFATWGQVQDYVDSDPAGADLAPLVNLVDAHGAEALVAALTRAVDESTADLVVSTAHRAKGREWKTVQVADDFPTPEDRDREGRERPFTPADMRLAYVTVTRARERLDLGGLAGWVPSVPDAVKVPA